MDGNAFVEEASHWAKKLVLSEMRCPGDHGPAMRRIARQVGVRWTLLKNLHYRLPHDVGTAEFTALGEAYAQRKLYQQERENYTPKTALGRILVGLLDAALDEKVGALNDD